MVRFYRFLSILIVSFLIFIQAAQAVEISQKGANELRDEIQKQIAEVQAKLQAQGDPYEIDFEGPLMVEPVNTYYAVTFPKVTIFFDKKYKVDVGMVAANVIPIEAPYEGAPNMWSVATALPTPWLLHEKDEVIGRMSIGQQQVSYLWVPEWKNAVNMDINLSDIRVFDFKTGYKARIDRWTGARGYEPTSQTGKSGSPLWTGGDENTIQGIYVENEKKKEQFKVEDIFYETKITGMDFAEIARATADMQEFQNYKLHNKAEFNAADVSTFIDFFKRVSDSYATSSGSFVMKNFEMKMPDPKKKEEMVDFHIDEISSFSEMEENLFSVELDLKGAAPKEGSTMSSKAGPFLPFNMRIAYSMSDLPEWEEVQPVIEKLQKAAQNRQPSKSCRGSDQTKCIQPELKAPNMKENQKTAMELLQIFQKANTKIQINDFLFDFQKVAMNVKGEGDFQEGAVYGIAGTVQVFLSGLDFIAGASANDLPKDMQKQAQQAKGFLPMLQMMGQIVEPASTAPDGSTIPEKRLYEFKVSPTGQMTMNGTDLSQMMGMFGGKKQQPEKAPSR